MSEVWTLFSDVTTDAAGVLLSVGTILLDSQFSVITEVVL